MRCDWLSPTGRYQQGPGRRKWCLGRASGGKENLSGKGASFSRQVRTMAAEVSMMGHWQSREARRWYRKQHKRWVWGGWAGKSLVFEDKKPEGKIWYFRAPLGLESMRPYWVIELGTTGYHRNEPLDPDGFAWFFISICCSSLFPFCLTVVDLWGLFFFTSFHLFSFLLCPKLLFSCFDLNYVYVQLLTALTVASSLLRLSLMLAHSLWLLYRRCLEQ